MFTDVISNCAWLLFLLSDSVLCFFFSLLFSLMLKHIHTCTLNHIYTYLLAFCMQACALTLSILCLCFKRGKPKVTVPLMTAKCNGLADTDRTRPNSWMVHIPWVFNYILNVPNCFFLKTTSLIRKTVSRRWNILYLLVNRLRSGYFGDSKDLW